MRQLQTVKDLARLFQKHPNSIYRWIVQDRLFPNAFKVKDGWYVGLKQNRRAGSGNPIPPWTEKTN